VDHRLDGKPILPVAVAMELMAEIAQRGWPDLKVIGLRDLRVLKGLAVDNGGRKIRVAARVHVEPPHDRLGVDVHAEILDAGAPAMKYYRCTVELAPELPVPPVHETAFGPDLRPYPLSVEEFYRDLLFHGPIFQGIREIRGISPNGMLAILGSSKPGSCLRSDPGGRWLIDPVVFDSGLQLALLWSRAHLDMTPLPAGYRAYRRFGSIEDGKLRCEMRISSRPADQMFHIDVAFIAEDGRLLGLLEGMECPYSKALNRLAGGHLREWPTAQEGR
ncbi:MAG TPA: polyketide synthase dehydratase domain-containing protein, partial [Candidatus Polarisedimenticolia bacterium]|nr:polyketide synthase dehydratase domain-containing protein [Candidatus Polarisedimenticolia bacterium]